MRSITLKNSSLLIYCTILCESIYTLVCWGRGILSWIEIVFLIRSIQLPVRPPGPVDFSFSIFCLIWTEQWLSAGRYDIYEIYLKSDMDWVRSLSFFKKFVPVLLFISFCYLIRPDLMYGIRLCWPYEIRLKFPCL